jgi:hypothetical protein
MPATISDWAMKPLEDELGEALRAELLGWPGVTIRPMMGCLAYFRGRQMLGSYVNRALSKRKPEWMNRAEEPTLVWVRLSPADFQRALRRPGVVPSRLGFVGWIEVPLVSRRNLEEAVRWLGRAYEHPPRRKGSKGSRGLRGSQGGSATGRGKG